MHREVFTPRLHKRTPERNLLGLTSQCFGAARASGVWGGGDSPPAAIRNRKPPWEKENTEEPGDTLRQELREKRSTLLEKAEERWQKKYDGSVKGNRFREIAPDAKCTIKLSKLPLAAFLRNSPRLIMSKLVQFRSGHALVGALRGVPENGHPICRSCLRL